MPALPSVPQVVKVIVHWSLSEKDGVNIFHVGYSGAAPTDAQLNTYAQFWFDLMGSAAPAWVEQYSLTQCEAIDLTSPTASSGSYSGNVPGTDDGEFIGANTAFLVNWTIARRYRGGHPRSYFPWGSAGDMTNPQNWDGGFVDTVQSLVSSILSSAQDTDIGSASSTGLKQVSYYGPNPTPPPVETTLRAVPIVDTITAGTAVPEIASMRRRDGRH
jgi:hypothetical protein